MPDKEHLSPPKDDGFILDPFDGVVHYAGVGKGPKLRKQRKMEAGVQLIFSFSFLPGSQGTVLSIVRVGLLSLVKFSGNSIMDTPRYVSMTVTNLVKLAMKIHHHVLLCVELSRGCNEDGEPPTELCALVLVCLSSR